MKHVIFLLLILAFCFGCHESNSVEPILDSSTQLNRSNDLDGTMSVPEKDSDVARSIPSETKYNFNPEALNKECGGCLNGTTLEYIVEGPERHISNAQIWAPSEMTIDGKKINTRHIYTINRVENIGMGGKTLEGTTWGTFEIKAVRKGSQAKLFEGEFKGEIFLNRAKIKLSGKGLGPYAKYNYYSEEEQVCTNKNGKLRCWTSKSNGFLYPDPVKEN